jgi:hypothetical protein
VDYLKTAGVVQGFWSVNPIPIESEHIRQTPKFGFRTIEDIKSLKNLTGKLLYNEMNYFSSMISKRKLGEFIRIAGQQNSDEEKAEKFLYLINTEVDGL